MTWIPWSHCLELLRLLNRGHPDLIGLELRACGLMVGLLDHVSLVIGSLAFLVKD